MDERLSRIQAWINGKSKGPYALDLMPTNRCNLSCIACHQRSIDANSYYENELSTQTYFDIIKQASELEVRRIHVLGGGEPFLREDIVDIMEAVKENNMYGYIVTNGTLLNERKIKKIVQMGWDEVVISLDAPDAETHDYLRQSKGTFDKIINAIKTLNNEKKSQKKENPKISINYLITRLNFNKLIETVKLCHKLNIKEIHLMIMLVCSRLSEELKINKDQCSILEHQFTKSGNYAKKLNIKNNFEDMIGFVKNDGNSKDNQNNKKINTKNICFEPFWHMSIGASGYVVPCPMCLDNCIFPRNDFAELITKETLKDIWYGPVFNKFRKGILDQKKQNGLCSNCCSTILLTSQKDALDLKNENGP